MVNEYAEHIAYFFVNASYSWIIFQHGIVDNAIDLENNEWFPNCGGVGSSHDDDEHELNWLGDSTQISGHPGQFCGIFHLDDHHYYQ